MSGWYYMKERVFGDDQQLGPLADDALLKMAFDGQLKLKTVVRHEKHTRNQWVHLEAIPAAKKNIEAGEKHRAEAKAAERAAKAAADKQLQEEKRAAQLAQQEKLAAAAAEFAKSPLGKFTADGAGPFCTTCFDSERRLIRVVEQPHALRPLGHWRCGVCTSKYD